MSEPQVFEGWTRGRLPWAAAGYLCPDELRAKCEGNARRRRSICPECRRSICPETSRDDFAHCRKVRIEVSEVGEKKRQVTMADTIIEVDLRNLLPIRGPGGRSHGNACVLSDERGYCTVTDYECVGVGAPRDCRLRKGRVIVKAKKKGK